MATPIFRGYEPKRPSLGRLTESSRYTRANPPSRLLVKFACLNQSEASKMEAAIKKLAATNKGKLVDKTGAVVRKLLFG